MFSKYCRFHLLGLLGLFLNTSYAEQLTSIEFTGLPDMAEIQDVREKKLTFFKYLQPMVAQVNQRIEGERAWLYVVERQINLGLELQYWQSAYLSGLANYYKVEAELGSKAYFTQMYQRVDVLPASLVLAQAANESAWGTSRFATEGNNLFGQWCFTEGCGLVPQGRDDSERHEVRVFDSVYDSIDAYFRNINTHAQYIELRAIRDELRFSRLNLDSRDLAWGLEGYSIRGFDYISELIEMIQYNNLAAYDQPAFYAHQAITVNDQLLN